MTVPFLDLARTYRSCGREIDATVRRVLSKGRYILGGELASFEAEFAAYCGSRHCVGVSSGLDALSLIMRALGIGEGDEVIVPAHTFIATWLAVSHAGARPVPVDIDPDTYTIDPGRVAEKITGRTRAILAVHLYGMPADMDPLAKIARGRGILLVEDAAQAHGARYKGRPAGSLGSAAGFSFYPTKNLGAFGDAGAVVTRSAGHAGSIRLLRNYGSPRKYVHLVKGFNARLDELQAALLRVMLRRLDTTNSRRKAIARRYLRGITNPAIKLPVVPAYAEPAWHLFVVRCRSRDALVRHLTRRGIETLIHYPVPPHRQRAYREYSSLSFPVTDRICREAVSLPLDPFMPGPSVEKVIDAVNAFRGNRGRRS